MQAWFLTIITALYCWLVFLSARAGGDSPAQKAPPGARHTFSAQGVIQELPPGQNMVVIKHDSITNYMMAMTMPFKVKTQGLLAGLHPGDRVRFRLNVTADESWVDDILKVGTGAVEADNSPVMVPAVSSTTAFMDYPLTNELGRKVCLNDFRGQALAITFFYTRCPLPDFCPRLSKNFQAAAEKLRARPGAPANWHFLSISFDTAFDTPAMLRAYGESYGYHPAEWSFLTGSPENIRELARISGVTYVSDSGAFKHNFRTLIIDPAGRLQTVFPIGGDLSDDIVAEIIKAAAVTHSPSLSVRAP
jgi:protein SCO1/2